MADSSNTALPWHPILISRTAELAEFLSYIPPVSTLYVDLEGCKLGRYGTVTFMTVLVYPQRLARVIDVQTLGDATFTTRSNRGITMKWILENAGIQKCFWDVRGDADALWALHGIELAGVVDVQLLENYTRPGDKTYLGSLSKAIYNEVPNHEAVRNGLLKAKQDYKQRMLETDVFAVRPVTPSTLQYCVNDVMYLPQLHMLYHRQLCFACLLTVEKATLNRLRLVRLPEYQPHTPSHRYGPWAPTLGIGDSARWFF